MIEELKPAKIELTNLDTGKAELQESYYTHDLANKINELVRAWNDKYGERKVNSPNYKNPPPQMEQNLMEKNCEHLLDKNYTHCVKCGMKVSKC